LTPTEAMRCPSIRISVAELDALLGEMLRRFGRETWIWLTAMARSETGTRLK